MSKGLMGLEAPSDGYQGVIQVGPMQVHVKDGEFQLQGKQFSVSRDGQVKLGDRQVGQVRNGQLVPAGGA